MTRWSQDVFSSLRKTPSALSGAEFHTGIWFPQALMTDLHTKNKQSGMCSKCVNTADGNTD